MIFNHSCLHGEMAPSVRVPSYRDRPGKKLIQCFWCEVTTGKLRYSSGGIIQNSKKNSSPCFKLRTGLVSWTHMLFSWVWKDQYPSMIFVVTLICKKRWKDSFALDSYIVSILVHRDHCELRYTLSVQQRSSDL